MASYMGVYRARALQVSGGTITAYVPQVFGDTAITITDVLGALPTGPTMGWVLFESGWPEFPVWASGSTTVVDGGGPIDPGSIPDEVWVGINPPSRGETELWFDPDAPVSGSDFVTDADLAAHEAAPDPHAGYLTTAEGGALITAHEAALNPHPVYTTPAEVTAMLPAVPNATYRFFANKAALDAASWPGLADGAMAWTVDTRLIWMRISGSWRPYQQRGTGNVTFAGSPQAAGVTVTYPYDFIVAPIVTCTCAAITNNTPVSIGPAGASNTACTFLARIVSGINYTGSIGFHWVATYP